MCTPGLLPDPSSVVEALVSFLEPGDLKLTIMAFPKDPLPVDGNQ